MTPVGQIAIRKRTAQLGARIQAARLAEYRAKGLPDNAEALHQARADMVAASRELGELFRRPGR